MISFTLKYLVNFSNKNKQIKIVQHNTNLNQKDRNYIKQNIFQAGYSTTPQYFYQMRSRRTDCTQFIERLFQNSMFRYYLPYIIAAIFTILIVGTIIIVLSFQDYTNTYYTPRIKLTIAGTNDLHGKYYPTILRRSDTLQTYTYGGLQIMASLIQILRNQSQGYFLYLDAGDQFQGGFQSSPEISSGQIIVDYFNHMNLATAAVGNHQFDFGQEYLSNYLIKLNHNVISANFIDNNYKREDSKYLPLHRQQRSKIYSFPLSQPYAILTRLPSIKIGVIGITNIVSLYSSSKSFPNSYEIQSYKQIVIQQSNKLKQQGVHAIILLSHAGNQCGQNQQYGIWTIQNMGNTQKCDKTDQIYNLIDNLPQNTINVVIQGHRHSTSHFFYKNISIMGNINDGNYLNALHMDFILQPNSIKIDTSSLKIQGPIPVCEKIFQNTKRCDQVSTENLVSAGNLIEWQFHGVPVKKDQQLSKLAKSKWGKIMQKYEVQIVKNFIPYQLERTYNPNNPLGNLITNLIASYMTKKHYEFDFIIINSDSFRSTWYPGVIRYRELRSMLPFQNLLYLFEIKGRDLNTLIRTIQNGRKRFYPTYGLSQVFQKVPGMNILNLVDLILSNGDQIIDDHIYRGATNDFLVKGGNDFKTMTGLFFNVKNTNENFRDIIRGQLESLHNLTQNNLRNPTNLQRVTVFFLMIYLQSIFFILKLQNKNLLQKKKK